MAAGEGIGCGLNYGGVCTGRRNMYINENPNACQERAPPVIRQGFFLDKKIFMKKKNWRLQKDQTEVVYFIIGSVEIASIAASPQPPTRRMVFVLPAFSGSVKFA